MRSRLGDRFDWAFNRMTLCFGRPGAKNSMLRLKTFAKPSKTPVLPIGRLDSFSGAYLNYKRLAQSPKLNKVNLVVTYDPQTSSECLSASVLVYESATT